MNALIGKIMENKSLNSQESIELIQRMISATHDRFRRGGGTLLLAGGYAALVFALLIAVWGRVTPVHYIYYLWWGVPLTVAVAAWIVFRREGRRTPQVRTFVERCVGYVWLTVGTVAVLYPLAGFIRPAVHFAVVPVETLLMGIGAILTGLIIRFRPIVLGGLTALVIGLSMFGFPEWYLELFMVMLVFAIILPGHILNYKGKACSDR